MLHQMKGQSILQWFNSLVTKTSIASLSQLTDGLHFHNIVLLINALGKGEIPEQQLTELSPNLAENLIESKDSGNDILPEDKNVSDSGSSAKDSQTAISVSNTNAGEDVAESDAETEIDVSLTEKDGSTITLSQEANEVEMQKRYEAIKAFIDGFFAVDSSCVIAYSDCIRGKELELAKVAVFLLSSLTQSYLSCNNELVYTTTLLDPVIQEEIKECLSLVLNEANFQDGFFRKAELHRILGRPSKFKASPRRRAPSRGTPEAGETPEVPKNVPKKRRDRGNMMNEDTFESPLKVLLESPKIQFKAGMFKKDAELSKLRNDLHIEESKVVDLRLEKRSLNDELEKKKRELEFLKEEYRKFRDDVEQQEQVKRTEVFGQLEEREKNDKFIQVLKEELEVYKNDVEFHKKEAERLLSENALLEEKLAEKFSLEKESEKKVKELETVVSDLQVKINMKNSLEDSLRKRVSAVEQELSEYKRYDEEFSARADRIKISPKVPETMKRIFYYDERDARDQLKAKEEEIVQLQELLFQVKEELKKREKLFITAEKNRCQLLENMRSLNMKLLNMESDLESCRKQLSIYEKWEKSIIQKDNIYAEQIRSLTPLEAGNASPSYLSEAYEREKNVKEESDFGKLWETFPTGRSRETRRSKSISNMSICSRDSLNVAALNSSFSCTESEFVAFKKDAHAIVKIIQKKFDSVRCPQLILLDEQLRRLNSIKDIYMLFHSLLECLKSAKTMDPFVRPEFPVKRKNRSQTTGGPDCNDMFLINQNKSLEETIEKLKQDMIKLQNEHKTQQEIKVCEIKIAEKKCKEMEHYIKDLSNNLKKSQMEYSDLDCKYEYLKKINEEYESREKNLAKTVTQLQEKAAKLSTSRHLSCKNCKKLYDKVLDLIQDKSDHERDAVDMKAMIRELEGRNGLLDRKVKDLEVEQKRLEFELKRETAFLRGSASDRNTIIAHYFDKGLSESRKQRLEAAQKSQLEQPDQVVSSNTGMGHLDMRESPERNSTSNAFGNKSIRGGFFQTDDEENFLNHSSIAEIHREPESDQDPGKRLEELQRRNTLCLPHLQSSYPLEIQNMTPSEGKYFNCRRTTLGGRQLFYSEADADLYEKQEAEFLGNVCNESENVGFSLRKRKGSELEDAPFPTKKLMKPGRLNLVKKIKSLTPRKTGTISKVKISASARQTLSNSKLKTFTPTRKAGNFSKGKTFKTPQSLRNLIQKRRQQ